MKSLRAEGLPVCLFCINLKPAKTADPSLSDLHRWLLLVLRVHGAPLSGGGHGNNVLVFGVLEQLFEGFLWSDAARFCVCVRVLGFFFSCCRAVVLRPFMRSWPLVVLQDSLCLPAPAH